MFGLSRSRQPKPRSFDYRPRFYNPQEEERQARHEQVPGARLRAGALRTGPKTERQTGLWNRGYSSRSGFVLRSVLILVLVFWGGWYLLQRLDGILIRAFSYTRDPDERIEQPVKIEYLEDEELIGRPKPLD